MPVHLELGSDGHSFHGKAIVVDSKSGKHFTSKPVTYDKASRQKEVVEEAVKKYGEPVTAKGLPDMRSRRKKEPTPKVTRTPVPPTQASILMAQLAERNNAKRMAALKHIEPKVSMMKEEVHHDEDKSIAPIKAKAKPSPPEVIKRVAFETKGTGQGSYQGGFTEAFKQSEEAIAKQFNISKNKHKPTRLSLKDYEFVTRGGLASARNIANYLFGIIPQLPGVYYTGKRIHTETIPSATIDPPRPLRSRKMIPIKETMSAAEYADEIANGNIKGDELVRDFMSSKEFINKIASGEITKDNFKTAMLWTKTANFP